jgi:transposase
MDHKVASALTRAEFLDTFKLLHDKCTQELRNRTGDSTAEPLYIYDNVSSQAGAPMSEAGLKHHQHVKTPPHSPDFNKPIEHSWNQVKRKLLSMIYEGYDVVMTPQLAQQWVQEAFFSITQDSVERDVKSLMDTWAIIKAPLGTWVTTSKGHEIQGAEGDYPPSAEYR